MDNRNFSHESVEYKNSERFQPSSEMILEELDEVTKVFECGHPNVYSAYWMTLQQAEEAHLNTPLFSPSLPVCCVSRAAKMSCWPSQTHHDK